MTDFNSIGIGSEKDDKDVRDEIDIDKFKKMMKRDSMDAGDGLSLFCLSFDMVGDIFDGYCSFNGEESIENGCNPLGDISNVLGDAVKEHGMSKDGNDNDIYCIVFDESEL